MVDGLTQVGIAAPAAQHHEQRTVGPRDQTGFVQSARHGLAWYELDLNWIGISTLRALGLAWDVKVAKIAHVVTTEHQVMPAEEAVA